MNYLDILALGNQDQKSDYIEKLHTQYVKKDTYGNLYVNRDATKVKPYVVAHLDTVAESKQHKTLCLDKQQQYLTAKRRGRQCNLGADDGVGVYAALTLFDELDIGLAFFRDEEIGCIGSSHAQGEWLQNASYFIQLDRKGHQDIIFNSMGQSIASDTFIEKVSAIGQSFDYKPCTGGLTDVVTLSTDGIVKVSCVNLSCGYYNPHKATEYIDLIDMQYAIDFARSIIGTLGNTHYPHDGTYYEKYDYKFNRYGANYLCDTPFKSMLYELALSNLTDEEIENELLDQLGYYPSR